MYLQCTTEESARRQQQFEQILLEMMGQRKYDRITVGQLCEKAGVSRNAFYRYFSSKDDVLCALLDHTLLDIYKDLLDNPQSPETYLEQIIPFLQYWQEKKALLDALECNGLDGKLLERCMKYNMERPFDTRHYPTLGTEETRYQATLFAITGIFTLILDWHHNGYTQSVAQMAETMERIMLQPMVSISKN